MTDIVISKKIYAAIAAAMGEVGFVEKTKKNTAQGYNFRGIEDIYASVQLVFAKHGIFSVNQIISERTEERQTKSGSNLIYRVLHIRHTFFAEDGSYVQTETIGEGMDSGDKASNKAMSACEKYSLTQLLKIPTEEAKDSEKESPEVVPKNELLNSTNSVHSSAISKKENKAASAGQPQADRIYNNSSKDQQTALAKALEKKEIPAHLWEEIGKQLDGKDKSFLDETISAALSGESHPQ